MAAKSWFLVQVKPNGYNLAARNLSRQGFELFAPREAVTRRVGVRFVTRREAMFPGYLFVAFDPASGAWHSVNSTYGVARLVSFTAQAPAPVPDALVAALQARCEVASDMLMARAFVPGEAVAFKAGPFADIVGKIERVLPDRRVQILIEIMGQVGRVSAEPSTLRGAVDVASDLAARGDGRLVGS